MKIEQYVVETVELLIKNACNAVQPDTQVTQVKLLFNRASRSNLPVAVLLLVEELDGWSRLVLVRLVGESNCILGLNPSLAPGYFEQVTQIHEFTNLRARLMAPFD